MYLLVTSILALGAGLVWWRGYRACRGTTLLACWWWTGGGLASVLLVEFLANVTGAAEDTARVWRFLAATATLCPGMALLGAKRPQDRAWQWIVASLWLILALPALQRLFLQREGMAVLHTTRTWFILAIWAFTAANTIWSRYAISVVLAAVGQYGLLQPSLPESWRWLPIENPLVSSCFIWSALLLVPWWNRSTAALPSGDYRLVYERWWLDFRSAFGLVWSLRFMERINQVALQNDWNVRLEWQGFRAADGRTDWELAEAPAKVLGQSMANLLRRFVSPEWIRARQANEVSSELLKPGE